MASPQITVVIPAHLKRVRNGMLKRAVDSVLAQTRPPDALVVAIDHLGEGAAATRQRGLQQVQTDYVAFLDSDDEMKPEHIERHLDVVEQLGASFVYAWFDAVGASDPLGHFGIPFNPHTPHHTTITVVCETAIAKEIGFVRAKPGSRFGNEDWLFILEYCKRAIERNLLMTHLAERTWRFNMHGGNTSGMPHQGDAAVPA